MAFKRRIFFRFAALLLCLALLVPSVPAAAANIYFTSLNDQVLPLTADTMPVVSGGVMYVPASVFDRDSTGIDLGIYYSYSRSSNTVTLFNLRQILVFDLSAGTCQDSMTGEYYSARGITRNGRPYLPAKMVCQFFGLTYTENALSFVDQGYLARIKSDANALDDETFIDAAVNWINQRLRDYNQSIAPPNDNNTSAPSEETPSTDDENIASTDVRTYLAFRCGDSSGLHSILNTLDSYGLSGLFFFTPQTLVQEGDLVRRIVGSGHSIGLLAEGEDIQQTLAVLEEGSLLLEQRLHLRTTMAYVPDSQRSEAEAEGWICWDETLTLSPSDSVGANTFASNTMQRLSGRTRSTYLTLDGGQNTARVLSSLLRRLEQEHFVVSIPLETRL